MRKYLLAVLVLPLTACTTMDKVDCNTADKVRSKLATAQQVIITAQLALDRVCPLPPAS